MFSLLETATNTASNAAATAADSAAVPGGNPLITMVIYLVVIGGFMYLFIFAPQKKRDKKAKELINSLSVGDKVTTIGGVSGKVINIKDDEVTVETSVMKTNISFKKWAVKDVEKPIES